MKISVVVPVHNQENFIEECIQSLLNQSFEEYELIMVDDASTDNSEQIIRKYCDSDNRLRYIKNKVGVGAGACRNQGLEIAQGEYVIFLDSDDFFDRTLLETAYKECKKDDLDMVLYQTSTFDNETGEKQCMIKWNGVVQLRNVQEVFNYKKFIGILFNLFPTAPWNRMIRRSLLIDNNIRFQEIRHNNDVYFACISMLYAKKVRYISHEKPLVFYRKNIKGQLTNNRSDHLGCAYEAIKELYVKLKDMRLWPLLQYDYIEKAFSILLDEYVKVTPECQMELIHQYRAGKLNNIGISYSEISEICGDKHRNALRLKTLLGQEEQASFEGTFTGDIKRNKKEIESLFMQLPNEEIAIWGAGKRAELFLEKCKEWNCAIEYVCDSNPLKQGTILTNKKIVAPQEIIGQAKYIFVLNAYFFAEIYNQLKKLKIKDAYLVDMEYYMKWACSVEEASVYIE